MEWIHAYTFLYNYDMFLFFAEMEALREGASDVFGAEKRKLIQ
jgi:hypothetical protein